MVTSPGGQTFTAVDALGFILGEWFLSSHDSDEGRSKSSFWNVPGVKEGVDIFARMLFSCMRVEIQYWGEGCGMIYKDSGGEVQEELTEGILLAREVRPAHDLKEEYSCLSINVREDLTVLEEEDKTGEKEET